MESSNRIRPLYGLLALLVSFIVCAPVFPYDNPELLPEETTPIIDLARTLSNRQKETLEQSLNEYEAKTGWKIRVLSQFESTPGIAVRKFWNLDERSLRFAYKIVHF